MTEEDREQYREQMEKFAQQTTIGDQDDPTNWYQKITFPSWAPGGMCKDAKKALLNCLRATDCYQKVRDKYIFFLIFSISVFHMVTHHPFHLCKGAVGGYVNKCFT